MSQRFSVSAYAQILSGSLARLVLQACYFALLVNALSLADYGVFASVLALSLILSGGGAFGFTAPLFRAATTRSRVLGTYLGAFIAYAATETALVAALGLGIHALTFSSYIGTVSFMAILLSEALFWRLIDMLAVVNNGLGRYRQGAQAGIIGSLGRLVVLGLFMAGGARDLDRWALFYLAGNAASVAVAVALLWPRMRIRWSPAILLRRLREALAFLGINTLQTIQIEADKLLVLAFAGQEQAGIYALSMRVIELLLLPIKSFFPPYVQSLLRDRKRAADWRASLRVEAALAGLALVLFAITVGVLAALPNILGRNVAAAADWFRFLPLVPVFRALLDYHREVMFAADRLAVYSAIAALIAALRLLAIAAVLSVSSSIAALIWPLNGLALCLYGLSAAAVWSLVVRPPFLRRRVPPHVEDVG